MCGRFTVVVKAKEIKKRFGAEINEEKYQPSYNAAPSQLLPVITNEQPDQVNFYRWGLIPAWAKDPAIGYKLINARADNLEEKPAFRTSFSRKRCLVIADGFYEWKKTGKIKQPYRITLSDNSLFAFAGLWDEWKNPEGQSVYSFTIITTEANNFMEPIHERMPAILTPQQEKIWLEGEVPLPELKQLLQPYDPALMQAYPVSGQVGNASHNSPELINPVTISEQGTLW